jgi:hypothetical protein
MDKHELVKTVITIVLTVIAKECLSWLTSWLKTIATSNAIKAIIKATMTRNRMVILFDIFALFVAVYILFSHAEKNHALNQWEVVFICIYTVNVLFWVASLFRDCLRMFEDWLHRKRETRRAAQ